MLVLGVDVGTQSLKVVVCDDALAILGEHRVGYGVDRPRADHAEQDPGAWERALGTAISGALAASRVHASDIAALAITGQLDGCVATDAAGDPIGSALIWQDRRAVDDAHAAPVDRVLAIAGQVADPSHLAPKARWLRRHGVRAARWHQPVSYLVERLTGIAAIAPSLASTTMLYDLAAAAWSPELLAAFAIAPGELPTIMPAHATAGELTARGAAITGLAIGTRVAVGTGDDFAMAIGAGVVAPGGRVICAIGTAEVVAAVAPTAIIDRLTSEPMVETHAFVDGHFFVENPGWLSGGAIRWASELVGASSDAAFDALAAAAPAGADGVTFIPALAGAMTPTWRPHARGTLHGLAAAHDRRHLARAVLEGLAFAARDVVERLAALGLPTAEVLLVGGGAASATWAQIRADVLGRPHHAARYTDALGAALLAAVAAGAIADVPTGAARIAARAITTTFTPTPDPAHAATIDRAYRRYQTLVAQLAPLALAPW
jgi:xylulokinase